LLDSDDYIAQDKLAKVVTNFQNHPEWVQIANYWTAVDQEGLPIRHYTLKTLSQGDVRSLLLKRGKYKVALTSALAYRRETLQQVLPLPSRGSADGYLMLTVPFYGQVGSIKEPLTFYRIHGKNKFARTTNLSKLIYRRELRASQINQTAARTGLTERFDLQQDGDYRLYKAIERGSVPWTESLQIIWLILQENIAIRRRPRKILTKLIGSTICVLFPSEGRTIISSGLNSYLRSKLLGKTLGG
ncbi:MAG: glucosyl transferase, partial [Moorea sp. SIO4A1]